jgi:hypothetical protein
MIPGLWLPALLTILVVTTSIPWLYPPRLSMPEHVDLAQALETEGPPLQIGTTTMGEFLPRWVTQLPPQEPAKSTLIAQDNPDRLQAVEGLTWTRWQDNPLDAAYTIRANRPLTVTYGQFYFPGWRATLNGAETDIVPSDPQGLITLAVPAGEHELRLTLGRTLAQTTGEIISAAALVVVVALAIFGKRSVRRRAGNVIGRPGTIPYPQLLLGVAAVSLWLFFTLVNTPLRRDTLLPNGVLGRPAMVPLDYAGELRLLTWEQSATTLGATEKVQLTLYWQPQREIGVPYLVGVQVRDGEGVQWQASVDRPADWRFIGPEPWPPDGYRMEPFEITLADGTPPGAYRFHVGVVRADTGQTVAVHDVGALQVTEPARGDREMEVGITATEAETAVYGNLRLLGTRLDRDEAAPGGIARVTALWQVTASPAVSNTYTLELRRDEIVALSRLVTIAPDYPLAQWQVGDRLRTETIVRLPASLTSGLYDWQVRWGDRWLGAGALQVTAPERTFTPPTVDRFLNETFGEAATLLGINLSPTPSLLQPSTPVEVTLVWRAEKEMDISYHVFVHLVDTDGQIVAQSDGTPAEWTRPTTGWLPGEIVLDRHQLALPDDSDGSLSLRVGLYDPDSERRLQTCSGEFVLVPLKP